MVDKLSKQDEFNAQVLDVLKNVREYFAAQDTEQVRADTPKTAKAGETQATISGGEELGMQPATGIAKELDGPAGPAEGSEPEDEQGNAPITNQDEEEMMEEEIPEDVVEEQDEGEEFVEEEMPVEGEEELKSLLKAINNKLGALQKNQISMSPEKLQKMIDKEVGKRVERTLHKSGFVKTRSDIQRIGVESGEEIKKSADEVTPESLDDFITAQSTKSWAQLGQEREATGDLAPFRSYRPNAR
jgi:hypothetical protein